MVETSRMLLAGSHLALWWQRGDKVSWEVDYGLPGNLPLGIVVPLVCKMIGMESFLLHYIHSFVVG
jgi:hypothetical protein